VNQFTTNANNQVNGLIADALNTEQKAMDDGEVAGGRLTRLVLGASMAGGGGYFVEQAAVNLAPHVADMARATAHQVATNQWGNAFFDGVGTIGATIGMVVPEALAIGATAKGVLDLAHFATIEKKKATPVVEVTEQPARAE
jgi:hypothetical protein